MYESPLRQTTAHTDTADRSVRKVCKITLILQHVKTLGEKIHISPRFFLKNIRSANRIDICTTAICSRHDSLNIPSDSRPALPTCHIYYIKERAHAHAKKNVAESALPHSRLQD